MSKYLFMITYLQTETRKLYKVSADNINEAEEYFCKQMMPLVADIDFNKMCDFLANKQDTIVECLGNIDYITTL